jgi:hypothetical protein
MSYVQIRPLCHDPSAMTPLPCRSNLLSDGQAGPVSIRRYWFLMVNKRHSLAVNPKALKSGLQNLHLEYQSIRRV